MSGTPPTVTGRFDKTSYRQGDPYTATITVTDAPVDTPTQRVLVIDGHDGEGNASHVEITTTVLTSKPDTFTIDRAFWKDTNAAQTVTGLQVTGTA
jgi:hypothetical protein